MKKVIAATINILATAVCLADAPTWSDDDIKADIIGSSGYVCANGAAIIRNMRNRALARCEGDTNRFARLLTEVAHTNNVRIASNAIWMLGRYGSAGDLPFLYSCVTNPACGKDAVASILNIEGVTSNSVAAAASYHSISNCNDRTRTEVFEMLAVRSYAYDESTIERQLGVAYALNYAATTGKYTKWMDRVLQRCDPTYKNSKRRLSVLRAEYGLGLDHWEIGYVTNAINELVAYPEADLPE
jgi:hypothetical protein